MALKPQVLRAEAARLKPIAASGTLMISIAAGTSVGFMAKHWGAQGAHRPRHAEHAGRHRPRHHALYAAPKATAKDSTLAKSLLAAIGQTVWVKQRER